ncbi:hypothetical protein [Pararhodospirillum photometricum]|nr:hypothetical protein [Pararhodospirillum photometricum]
MSGDALALAELLLVLGGGLGFFVWQAWSGRRERQRRDASPKE